MGKYLFLIAILCQSYAGFAQDLSGSELLEKAITYHDPQDQWKSFRGSFQITMESPDRPLRKSTITLDLPRSYFKLEVEQKGTTASYVLEGDTCTLLLNGSSEYTEEEAKAARLSCDRGTLMKDYYTYLYGLPMKLRDPGTQLDPVVQRRSFKGSEYLVLKVTYEQNVGEDTWYFYFHPKTYALKVYQFFHDESKNDGEYILLEGEEMVQGIRMPKTRAWYMNKDNAYLATDTLHSN